MIAKIYFNDREQNNYSGEGSYILVLPDESVIAQHFCTDRSWAEIDLTSRIEDILKQYNITEVYSNDKLIWTKHKKISKKPKRYGKMQSKRFNYVIYTSVFKKIKGGNKDTAAELLAVFNKYEPDSDYLWVYDRKTKITSISHDKDFIIDRCKNEWSK